MEGGPTPSSTATWPSMPSASRNARRSPLRVGAVGGDEPAADEPPFRARIAN